VREEAQKYKVVPEQTRNALLMRAAGQKFYNTLEYSLDELIRRPNDIKDNFSAYLQGLSTNVNNSSLKGEAFRSPATGKPATDREASLQVAPIEKY